MRIPARFTVEAVGEFCLSRLGLLFLRALGALVEGRREEWEIEFTDRRFRVTVDPLSSKVDASEIPRDGAASVPGSGDGSTGAPTNPTS